MAARDRLTYAYLLWTVSETVGTQLLGTYRTLKGARCQLDLTTGDYVPVSRGRQRVLQKVNPANGQYWYVEKHVLRDGV